MTNANDHASNRANSLAKRHPKKKNLRQRMIERSRRRKRRRLLAHRCKGRWPFIVPPFHYKGYYEYCYTLEATKALRESARSGDASKASKSQNKTVNQLPEISPMFSQEPSLKPSLEEHGIPHGKALRDKRKEIQKQRSFGVPLCDGNPQAFRWVLLPNGTPAYIDLSQGTVSYAGSDSWKFYLAPEGLWFVPRSRLAKTDGSGSSHEVEGLYFRLEKFAERCAFYSFPRVWKKEDLQETRQTVLLKRSALPQKILAFHTIVKKQLCETDEDMPDAQKELWDSYCIESQPEEAKTGTDDALEEARRTNCKEYFGILLGGPSEMGDAKSIREEAIHFGEDPEKAVPVPEEERHLEYHDEFIHVDTRTIATEMNRIMDESIQIFEENLHRFTADPSKDFIRAVRNLPLDALVKFMMFGLGAKSAEASIPEFFTGSDEPTAAAILKARSKIDEKGFQFFFRVLTEKIYDSEVFRPFTRKYMGFTLAAFDGSEVQIHTDPTAKESYCEGAEGKSGYNLLRICALYDILNDVFIDYDLSGCKKSGERDHLYDVLKMVPKDPKLLLTLDMGFESYATLGFLHYYGIKYVLRIKDSTSNGILSGLDPARLNADLSKPWQIWPKIGLCVKRPPKAEQDPTVFYKVLKGEVEDYPFLSKEKPVYIVPVRILQFMLTSGKLEALCTNVPSYVLNAYDTCIVYGLRWTEEGGFHTLKKYECLDFLHSKKEGYVRQEIHAKMAAYNVINFLISHLPMKPAGDNKYATVPKRSVATIHCRQLFSGKIDMDTFCSKVGKKRQPLREYRHFPRNINRIKRANSFNGNHV